MNTLKKLFPYSFRAADVKSMVIKIIVYIVVGFVLGLVCGLLGAIPLVGFIFRIIGWVVDLYCLVGIVLVVLDYLKVFE